MAAEPLKVICYAFAEIDTNEWLNSYEGQGSSADSALEEAIQTGSIVFTLIGFFGMKDPIRASVPSTIQFAREDGNI